MIFSNKKMRLSFVLLLHLHRPYPISSGIRPSPVIILRLNLLHLGQHLLRTIFLHAATFIRRETTELGLRAAPGRVTLGLLEHPLLGRCARDGDYWRVLVILGPSQPLHGSSLSLPFLLGHLLFLPTIRPYRIILILTL